MLIGPWLPSFFPRVIGTIYVRKERLRAKLLESIMHLLHLPILVPASSRSVVVSPVLLFVFCELVRVVANLYVPALADPSKYTGAINYVPSNTGDWYISASMAYDNSTFLTGAGLVDTGTILIYLSEPQFSTYLSATGGVYNSTIHMVSITKAQ